MEAPQSLTDDLRYLALRNGLEQLTCHQLTVLAEHLESSKPMVLDGCNYDAVHGTWCPLAVALEVDRVAQGEGREIAADVEAKEYVVCIGRKTNPRFHLNPMSGIVGEFFTRSRRSDLLHACAHVLEEGTFYRRSQGGGQPSPTQHLMRDAEVGGLHAPANRGALPRPHRSA